MLRLSGLLGRTVRMGKGHLRIFEVGRGGGAMC